MARKAAPPLNLDGRGTATADGLIAAQVAARRTADPSVSAPVREVPLAALTMEEQPRELVPEARLQELVAADRARPAALLAVLQEVAATEPYFAAVYDELQGLAMSINDRGVYQPIEVTERDGRLIVRDGHRRCLACALLDHPTVPAVMLAEVDHLDAVARPFVVNLQRATLTALEQARALWRLSQLVYRHLAEEHGADVVLTLDELLGEAAAEGEDGDDGAGLDPAGRPLPGRRALKAMTRQRVMDMVGLTRDRYYRLLKLNRLTPEARMAARGLGETLLAPLVTVPAELQADLAQVVTRHGLSKREVTSIAAAAREYGRDGVQRIIEGWQQPTGARARRSAVSWEALLTAVPQDVDRRCAALRAELSALPPKRRQARLEQIAAQRRLLAALGDHFDAILAEYGEAIRTDDADEQEMPPASS